MALETTATFIGHNECFGLSAEKLKNAIRELIEKGVTDFLSGGQGGFDRLCGRCVYELKKEYPHINNYLIIPYRKHFQLLTRLNHIGKSSLALADGEFANENLRFSHFFRL